LKLLRLKPLSKAKLLPTPLSKAKWLLKLLRLKKLLRPSNRPQLGWLSGRSAQNRAGSAWRDWPFLLLSLRFRY
jgi:hypothetical protein